MNPRAYRPLDNQERNLLVGMLPENSLHSQQIRDQLGRARVRTIDEFGSLEFEATDCCPMDLPDGPFMNALQEDADTEPSYGPYVNYIIFLKDGRIGELQIYKDDGSAIFYKLDRSRVVAVFPARS